MQGLDLTRHLFIEASSREENQAYDSPYAEEPMDGSPVLDAANNKRTR